MSRPPVATMRRKAQAYGGGDIRQVLPDAPRPGQPLKLDGRVAAHVALSASSEAPPGVARWPLQWIADRLIELNRVEGICLESVRQALKNRPQAVAAATVVHRADYRGVSLAYGRHPGPICSAL